MYHQSHVLIAANPKSGASSGARLVSQLREALQVQGLIVEICQSLDDVAQRSSQLHSTGVLRAVVAAGGDGTAAAVANLIPLGAAMVVLPLGTENLFAKYLGADRDIARSVRSIIGGKRLTLDAGLAGQRLFLVMLGCGFDAAVVEQMHRVRRGHINRWSYAKPICQAVRSYAYPAIEIECLDGTDCEADQPCAAMPAKRISAAWLFAFNLPRYAANLPFCPQACGDDGYLDLCTFARGGIWRGFYYLAHLWMRRHQHLKDFHHHRSAHFRITSKGSVPYQVDGDPGGQLPLEVRVLPGRLTVLVP